MRRHYHADSFFGCEGGEAECDEPVALSSDTLHDWGGYVQVEWGFRRPWTAGLRYEYATGSGASVGIYDGRGADPFRDNRQRISPLLTFHPSGVLPDPAPVQLRPLGILERGREPHGVAGPRVRHRAPRGPRVLGGRPCRIDRFAVPAAAFLVAAFLAAPAGAEKLRVVVTIPDLGSLAESVGGEDVEVVALVKGPQDPHFLEPRPSFIRVAARRRPPGASSAWSSRWAGCRRC